MSLCLVLFKQHKLVIVTRGHFNFVLSLCGNMLGQSADMDIFTIL